MSAQSDPTAVAVARAHVEAWSNHDYDEARARLAPDVHVLAVSVDPGAPRTDLSGVDAYMEGLIKFAQAIEPGSARVLAGVGDERTALLLLSVRATLGPGGPKVTLPAARLAVFDEHDKHKQVVFFAMPE